MSLSKNQKNNSFEWLEKHPLVATITATAIVKIAGALVTFYFKNCKHSLRKNLGKNLKFMLPSFYVPTA